MPRYDYHCESCDKVHEQSHRMDEKPDPCPCGSKKITKVICVPRFNKPADSTWHMENNGLGRWLPQAGPRYLDGKTKKKPNPKAYARSRTQAIERFKERGYTDISKD